MKKWGVDMKVKRVFCVICVASVFFFCSVFQSFGFNDEDAEAYLWRLINEARAKPGEVIEKYDIDVVAARNALGDNKWILDLNNGLPPLAWNSLLAESAGSHAVDMVDNRYYDYTSRDGRTIDDRIAWVGYNAEKTGENLGLLSFENLYVDPIEAAENIFVNMLREALNPESLHPANIFSIDMTEVGVSFISTVFSWENMYPLNVYLATIDFAKPVEDRHYVLGNIYRVAPPVSLDIPVAGDSLNKEWAPEKASSGLLFINYLNGEDSVAVEQGRLGTYQVESGVGQYFLLNLYDSQANNLKTTGGLGLNTNQHIDIVLTGDAPH